MYFPSLYRICVIRKAYACLHSSATMDCGIVARQVESNLVVLAKVECNPATTGQRRQWKPLLVFARLILTVEYDELENWLPSGSSPHMVTVWDHELFPEWPDQFCDSRLCSTSSWIKRTFTMLLQCLPDRWGNRFYSSCTERWKYVPTAVSYVFWGWFNALLAFAWHSARVIDTARLLSWFISSFLKLWLVSTSIMQCSIASDPTPLGQLQQHIQLIHESP